MDQGRDELLEANVKGKNPFKDIRVRRAIYQAIDIEAIRQKIMGGQSTPTGLVIAPSINGFDQPSPRAFRTIQRQPRSYWSIPATAEASK